MAPLAPPYDGLRVIELAHDPAGEILGKLLAEQGADVVKLEPPEGAASRHVGPFHEGVVDIDHSLTFWYYNTNKRSVVVDDSSASGIDTVRTLAGDADVLVSTLSPADLRARSLDYHQLTHDHQQLIVVSLTPFGLDGPWSDYVASDLVSLAAGSVLNMCGYDDHSIPPIRPGGEHAAQVTASFGHIGLLLALLDRQRTHRGQVVDVATHDALAVTPENSNLYWNYPRLLVQRQTCRAASPTPTQPTLFRCRDGRYVMMTFVTSDLTIWRGIVDWLGQRELALDLGDPKFEDQAYRQQQIPYIQTILESFFMLLTAEEAFHEGQARRLALGPVNLPDDLFADEHLAARGFFRPVADGSSPGLYPSSPFRLSDTDSVPLTRAPRLGEHTDAVLGG